MIMNKIKKEHYELLASISGMVATPYLFNYVNPFLAIVVGVIALFFTVYNLIKIVQE